MRNMNCVRILIGIVLNSLTIHPFYNLPTIEYDFAIFKLQRRVDFNALPNVYPACWPTREPTQGTTVRKLLFSL